MAEPGMNVTAAAGQPAMGMDAAGLARHLATDSNGVVQTAVVATSVGGGITSTARLLSAAGTNQDQTIVKASAGKLYAIQGYNGASAVRYLKLYNKASLPTSADTPVKTLALPAGAAFAFDWDAGYSFTTGIGFRLTTGVADADTAGVTAADILGLNLDYV